MSEKITENLSQAPVPVESVYTAEAFRTLLTNKGLTTVDEKTLAYIAWPIHIDKGNEDKFIADLAKADSEVAKMNITAEFLKAHTKIKTENLKEGTKLQIADVKRTLESAIISKDSAPSVLSESFFAPLFTRGYTFAFEGTGVRLERSTTEGQDMNDLNILINGYISSKKLSLDDLKTGLLYQTSSFGEFVAARTDKEGNVLNGNDATLAKYVEILRAKTPKTVANDTFLASYGTDGASYVALESTVVAKHKNQTKKIGDTMNPAIANGLKTGTIDTGVGKIDVSSEAAQRHLKNFDGKKFSEDFIKAPVGTTIELAGNIVKASGSSAPIVLLGFLFLAFKGLTGSVKGVPGWQILLGGLFAHGVAKAFGGPEALGKVIDGVGEGDKATVVPGGSSKNDEGKGSEKGDEKGGNSEEEKKEEELTIPQQALHDRLLENKEIKSKVNDFATGEKKKGPAGKTGTLEDYAKFISSSEFQKLKPEYLFFNENHADSVFSLTPGLSAHVALPSKLHPMIFKLVMRAYLTTTDSATRGSKNDQDAGVPEKEAFLQANNIVADKMKDKTMKDVAKMVHEKMAKPVPVGSAPNTVPNAAPTAALSIDGMPTGLNVTPELSSDKQTVTIKFDQDVISNNEKTKQLTLKNTNNSTLVRFKGTDYTMILNGSKITFTKK